MEQLVILVIIGLISLVNWLMQKSAEKREAAKMKREQAQEDWGAQPRRNIYTQPAPAPAARRAPAPARGRDPLKDLMDALGLPADALPPPPVQHREFVPDYFEEEEEFSSMEDVEPPPLPASAAQKKRLMSWQQPARPAPPDEKTARLASAFAAGEQKLCPAYDGASARSLLSGRTAQRQAIIMAEIVGKPRGLAPVGELPGRGW